MKERLQKLIAQAGIASRRKAEELIQAGRVQVNGTVVTELGSKADLLQETVTVDGKPLTKQELVVYVLNKPLDVVSTSNDPGRRQTVLDFVPKTTRVYPVGRLDRMTEGLILLTNDGDLALKLTHPRYEHEKEYELIGVTKLPVDKVIERLRRGTQLTDGPIKPDRVELAGIKNDRVILHVTLHEGRNHLVRRLTSAIGFELTILKRIRIGTITLGDLPSGKFRQLQADEIAMLLGQAESSA